MTCHGSIRKGLRPWPEPPKTSDVTTKAPTKPAMHSIAMTASQYSRFFKWFFPKGRSMM